jgi:acetoin utilization deacetylase AcuC-like enzyme
MSMITTATAPRAPPGRTRARLLFLHADPREEHPYFAGFADELGEGDGRGCNSICRCREARPGTSIAPRWPGAAPKSTDSPPDALVVLLGVDTFAQDPISAFLLQGDDYLRMGEAVGALGLRTLFAMEGGYAVGDIGVTRSTCCSASRRAVGAEPGQREGSTFRRRGRRRRPDKILRGCSPPAPARSGSPRRSPP